MMAVGSCGMYVVVVVVLPAVQAEFGVARADASLPHTLTMIGFGIGGVLMQRLAGAAAWQSSHRQISPAEFLAVIIGCANNTASCNAGC